MTYKAGWNQQMAASSSFGWYLKNTSLYQYFFNNHVPDSKVHGTNMGPIWDQQDPGGPHISPMDIVIWGNIKC